MRISTACNNKATTISMGNLTIYVSYETVVGFYTPKTGTVFTENVWGPTTGKHLSHFGSDKASRIDRTKFLKMLEKIEKKLDSSFKFPMKIVA
jgi:hypothetical protein